MKSVPNHWDDMATLWRPLSRQQKNAAMDLMRRQSSNYTSPSNPSNWAMEDFVSFDLENEFACDWVAHGRIIYSLSHSMAALFALTSAPSVERLPHEAFAIKVPREFLPALVARNAISGGVTPGADTWIGVGRRNGCVMIMPVFDSDTTATSISFFDGSVDGNLLEKTPEPISTPWNNAAVCDKYKNEGLLARRIAANLIAFVLSPDRNGETVRRASKRSPQVFEVKPPRDVVIDRSFREAAAAAVRSDSLGATRRALAHVVRGHWRNQPVGTGRSERRLTWVRPHKRGDESFGSVVSRIERINA